MDELNSTKGKMGTPFTRRVSRDRGYTNPQEIRSWNEMRDLIQKMQNGDENAREKILLGHQRLIKKVAASVIRNAPIAIDLEDLVQEGYCIMMTHILKKADINGAPIVSFAEPILKLYMRAAIRGNHIVYIPQDVMTMIRKYRYWKVEVENKHGKDASLSLIADSMGTTRTEVSHLAELNLQLFRKGESPLLDDDCKLNPITINHATRGPHEHCEQSELIGVIKTVIGSRWGKNGVEFFLRWIDSEDLFAFAEEEGLSLRVARRKIVEMVTACRAVCNIPEKFSPTVLTEDRRIKRHKLKNRRMKDRQRYAENVSGKRTPPPDHCIILTEDIMGLRPVHIQRYIASVHKLSISLMTASVAKRRGWLRVPDWRAKEKEKQRVYLTKDDLAMTALKIGEKYGLGRNAAYNAKRNGFYLRKTQE